jgi:hypothetical protein
MGSRPKIWDFLSPAKIALRLESRIPSPGNRNTTSAIESSPVQSSLVSTWCATGIEINESAGVPGQAAAGQ